MFSILIESIASTLAEHFAGKAAEKGLQRTGKARGWIVLACLVLILGLVIWLGIYLLQAGVWPIALLMFIIALFLAYVTVVSILKSLRKKQGGQQ